MAKQRRLPRRALDAPAIADASAFRAAVRDVKPLPQKPVAEGLAKPGPRPRRRASAAPAVDADDVAAAMPLIDASSSEPGAAPVAGADALSFRRAGVREQSLRHLRRGLYPIEDELDLHGLSQPAARDLLAEFLDTSRRRGRRCVRIIHGKGYRSGARGPILKIAVNAWLRRHLDVLAFASARPIDGGTGAVYVLLRA